MDFRDDCAVQSAAPEFPAAANAAGKHFYVLKFGRAQRCDAAIRKIALVVECSGVAKVAWQLQFRGETKALAEMEDAHSSDRAGRRGSYGGFLIGLLAIDTEPDTGMNLGNVAEVSGYSFAFDIERLAGFSEAAGLKAAIARDVSDDLKFLAICVGLNASVEARRGSAELNVQRTEKKEDA